MAGIIIRNGKKISFSDCQSQQISDLKMVREFLMDWFSEKTTIHIKTSGSTGKPKLIEITKAQMKYSAERTIKALQLEQEINALLCINPTYIGGKMMLVRSILQQWNLTVIEQTSNPAASLSPNARFEFAAMVPLQLETMLRSVAGTALLNNINKIVVGGALSVKHSKKKYRH